jgi:hypothetical protein
MSSNHRHARSFSAAAALAVFLGLGIGIARGQAVNATLLGTVTDASGAVIPNATVTITEQRTGVSRSGKTNESGNYTFPDLPPGTYSVAVEVQGFKKEVRQNINVIVNTEQRVDVQLEPGNISQSVEVSAATPPLETDRADTGRNLESQQLEAMPLGTNRNFQSMLNLVPGTTRAFFAHSQFFNAQSALSTQVNGQSRLANNLQLEGIDDNERTGLLQVLIPPMEAIQTVDASTSNYDAELGRATGAVTNVILKSGTNDFHGELYEFLQNSDLNSRNFFDKSIGPKVYNMFGGTLGGRIIRNRTFFFVDYQKVFDHEANANLASIPTPGFRTGDLSASPTVIYNPFTGNPNGTGRVPFPNNQIPASMINPIAAKLIGLVPEPNNGAGFTNNYFALLPFSKDSDSTDIKIDDNTTSKDRFSGRFSFQRPVVYQAPIFGLAGGPAQGAFEGTGSQTMYSAGINYDHIFSPTLIAEARVGVNRYRNVANNADYGTNASTAIGIPGVNIEPFTSGLSGVNINGFSSPIVGYSPSMPWVRAETNIDAVNTWTKIVGNHTIKFGVDLRRIRDDLLQEQTFSPRGLFAFADGQTSIPGAKTSFGNDFASFLLDVPNLVGRDLPIYFPAYRATQFFTFIQDKWVVTPKLTITAGLRWEYYPPATPHFPGGFSNYDPVTNSLILCGLGNNPLDCGIQTNYADFGPRFGAAYRLTEKTVIRTGFGISYAPFPDNNYAYNFPVKQNNSFNPAVSGFGPALLPSGQIATFQAGFPPPTPAVVPSNGIIANANPNQQYFIVNPHFREPYVESWNFAIEQALPEGFTLDAAYVGNHGVDQPANMNINAGLFPGRGVAGQPLYNAWGIKASTNLLFQGFSSSYNALQVKLDRQFQNGLLITTSYTYGKALGYQSEDGGLQYYINAKRNYAPTSFNRTHTFVQSYLWELPFGKGKRWVTSGLGSNILGGWQINGILTAMSGTPLNFTYSSAGLEAPGNGQSPNLIAPVKILHGINIGNPWFSTSSFAAPAAGTFGNLGPYVLGGPGFFNLDASLFRTFTITERFRLEMRFEGLSITNTPQFSNPGTNLGSANFGYVTGAGGARTVQLGARLMF